MIVLTSDHAGYLLKEVIKKHLTEKGVEVLDVGPDEPAPCDYPDMALKATAAILSGRCDKGVLVCGTGVGMSMAANKVPGIRAAVCSDTFSARMTRAHNDANVLCVGERVVGPGLACDLVDIFLATPFENAGNHPRRVGLIADIEQGRR